VRVQRVQQIEERRVPMRTLFLRFADFDVGSVLMTNGVALRTKCGVLRSAQNDSFFISLYQGKFEVLEYGLGAEGGVVDCGSAMGAEGRGWVDEAAACVAFCRSGWSPGPRVRTLRQAQGRLWGTRACRYCEDAAGDVDGLSGVVLADAAGHEEGLDPGDDHREARPEED
jgi:hypothetical protein